MANLGNTNAKSIFPAYFRAILSNNCCNCVKLEIKICGTPVEVVQKTAIFVRKNMKVINLIAIHFLNAEIAGIALVAVVSYFCSNPKMVLEQQV